jgi:hypothetical protein
MTKHLKAPFHRHVLATLHLFAGSKSGAMRVGSGEGGLFQRQRFDLRVVQRFGGRCVC